MRRRRLRHWESHGAAVFQPDPVDTDRLGDVLDLVIAEVFELEVYLAVDMVENCPGDQDAARLGDASSLAATLTQSP